MSDGTKIEWTDATWNVVNGCSLESPGCTNCYAMRLAGTRLRNHPSRAGLTQDTKAGPVWTGEVRFNEKVLDDPLRWRQPRRIFVCAHGDLFHPNVPTEWIDKVFAVMAAAPHHQFQVLTKRSERMLEYARQAMGCGEHWLAHCERSHAPMWPLPNVWLGVSVEDQQRANQRIPDLLLTPAAVRWLSCEPLLGPLDLTNISTFRFRGAEVLNALTGTLEGMFGDYCATRLPPIDWVVTGGESGPGARPMHPAWARSLRDQCEAAGAAFLFKQWGDWVALSNPDGGFWPTNAEGCRRMLETGDYADDGLPIQRVGKKFAGRLLDGAEHNDYPAELAA